MVVMKDLHVSSEIRLKLLYHVQLQQRFVPFWLEEFIKVEKQGPLLSSQNFIGSPIERVIPDRKTDTGRDRKGDRLDPLKISK